MMTGLPGYGRGLLRIPLPPHDHPGDMHPLDLQRSTSVVLTLAVARLAMTGMALLAMVADPPHPDQALDEFVPFASVYAVLVWLLSSYLVYGVAVLIMGHLRPLAIIRLGWRLHVADFCWIATLTAVTGGANSPFAAFFVFVLLAAGFRWGLWATLGTGFYAILVLAAEAVVAEIWGLLPAIHLNTMIMRVTYIGLGAALVGILAEEERRQRIRSRTIARIMGRVRAEPGLVASVRAVFDELLATFSAPRGILAIEEDGRDRVFLWNVQRPPSGGLPEVRLRQGQAQADAYMFPVPANVEVLRITRRSAGAQPDVIAIGVSGLPRKRPDIDVTPLLAMPVSWQSILCAVGVAGHGWTGRVFVFDPRETDGHGMRFLQAVVYQAAPALFNLYLQRRLLSDSGVVERARIARELHDGVIQSLIGLEMELEVLRREAAPSLPEAARSRLADVQRMLGQEILTVRDLMQALKPVEVEPARFVEHLAETVERFRYRTGIDARLACDRDTVDLPRRTCGELAYIVQEALANVRKHSGASHVLVRLTSSADGWTFVIDDDGRGFDFEGLLTHDELEKRRVGPVILKERVNTIGGRLSIDSRPGRGSRLEISIPTEAPTRSGSNGPAREETSDQILGPR